LECGWFPLTPALSLGEREPPPQTVRSLNGIRFADRLAKIFPLPKGEGKGEGKGDVRMPHGLRIGFDI
jgi:hypothetical protein